MSSPIVAALVVTHDGARWLPQVIEGLREQRRRPDHLVFVDTGSRDESVQLASAIVGEAAVVRLPGSTGFPQAVAAGLEHLRATGVEPEWLWILHDDSRPAPAALGRLLERVEQDPDADFVGPKLREWPSLRRLLEVGITMSGTGRRETGLERGEYDQGQHDESREVLAVHSAGLLARTTTFEALGGFDPQLPIFGNDLDLGWRAASAGYKTVVEPAAVVFHAEAAHRGIRRTPLTGRHTHYAERRAALYTLLANVRPGALPYAAVRIGFGSLVRVLGLLLVRSVGQALDELAALLAFYAHPRQIHQARRARHDLHAGDSERVAALLAPWWLPYRHGLDAVRDFASAATRQAQDVAERRRLAAAEAAVPVSSARRAKVVAPPTLDDEEELPAPESGVMVRFLTSPVALLVTGFALLTVVGLRFSWGALAGGELAGGALAPAPDSAAVWWRSYLSGWQLLGQGTALSAPPYLAVLSALAAITPGGPNVAVGLLLTGAVPLGMWGMWRLLRVLGRLVHPGGFPTWLLAGGAATYALVPVTSGAYGSGQFGLVVLAALLPWLTHAALGFAEPEVERRWRAAWRTALLLTVLTAFVPAAWWLAAVLTVAAFGAVVATTRTADRANWAPALVTLGVPLVLLCPWWLALVTEGGSAGLFLDAGRLLDPVTGWSLLDGRVSRPPSGGLVGGGLVLGLLAAVALLPRATRLPVTLCWAAAVVVAAFAAVLSRVPLDLPGGAVRPSLGLTAVVIPSLGLLAVCLAAGAAVVSATSLASTSTARRGVVAAVATGAVLLPSAALAWTIGWLPDTLALGSEPPPEIPAYMLQSSQSGPQHGVLVLEGGTSTGFVWTVRRGDGLRLGEHEVVRLQAPDPGLSALVGELTSLPSEQTTAALADAGLEYLVMPSPVDGAVAARLDATAGLAQASAESRQTRAWRVEAEPNPTAVNGSGPGWRPVALLMSGLALIVALVMAGPSRVSGRVSSGGSNRGHSRRPGRGARRGETSRGTR